MNYQNGNYKIVVFFFQAEDGIRVHCVTGVQTCALPICADRVALLPRLRCIGCPARPYETRQIAERYFASWLLRSEERRVGKECRSRWSRYQHCKKTIHSTG